MVRPVFAGRSIAMSAFSLDITEKRSFYLIAVSGELAAATLPQVRKAAELGRGSGYLQIVFDLSALKSIDRASADFVSYLHNELLNLGGGVHFIAESESFGFIHGEQAGSRQIPIYRSVAAAEEKIPPALRCFDRGRFMQIRVLDAFNAGNIIAVRGVVEKLLHAGYAQLVFDLSRCESIDSNALGMMLNVKKKAAPLGGQVAIMGANDTVMNTLESANVSHIIPCYRSLDAIDW
jgi:anti-anti-sigma factor